MTEIKLKLFLNNNENILKIDDIEKENIVIEKKEPNEKERYEKIIKELKEENKILTDKLNYYEYRIKIITAEYEQKINKLLDEKYY